MLEESVRVSVQSLYEPGSVVISAMWLIPATALSTLPLHLPLKLRVPDLEVLKE